jgi:DNA-binding IclR family transcriptional regulator
MAVVKAGEKQKYKLQLVVETFLMVEKILEATGGLGLAQICQCTQITKNKAFRILATLIQCGILEKDERSNYKIGITSIQNAHKILANASSLDKVRLIMESLSKVINEAVYFAKYNGTETVLIDFADCCQPIKAASFIGAAIQLPPVTRGTTVAKIGDIIVDTDGLSSEITTVSLPYFNGAEVAIGALVILAPTYRMTPYRIITEIVPALRDVMQCQQSQSHYSLQERLLPVVLPVWRE